MIASLAALPAAPAAAHKPSDSYLRVLAGPAARRALGPETPLALRWDLSLKDLHFLVGLDANGDDAITWGELKGRRDAVAAAALSRLSVEADGVAAEPRLVDLLVDEHSDGAYAVLLLAVEVPGVPGVPEEVRVRYRLLFDSDPTHRGLVSLDSGGGPGPPEILGPERDEAVFAVGAPGSGGGAAGFAGYVREGAEHIWAGLDHALFLLTLLLPAVLLRREGQWAPAGSFRAAAGRVLAVVTAFTVAHTVTLWVATAGLVEPPSRLVEASIAASIVVCAAHNLLPRVPVTGVGIAFAFGLLHGFGFAGVLADLGLGGAALGVALLGFNLGVELGQLAVVAAFLPVAWLLRETAFYRRVVLQGGSVAVGLIAALWLAERALGWEVVGF